MDNINWKQKLSSRKFWLAIIGVVSALMAILKLDAGSMEQITTLIMSFGTLIAYILAEGFVDGKRESGDVYYTENEEVE